MYKASHCSVIRSGILTAFCTDLSSLGLFVPPCPNIPIYTVTPYEKKQLLCFAFPTHESKKAALKIFIQKMLLWMHTIFIVYKYIPQTFFHHYLFLCGVILRGGSLHLYMNSKAYIGNIHLTTVLKASKRKS